MRWLVAIAALGGCNQIFGLQDTKLVDGAGAAIAFVQVNDGESPVASMSSVDFLSPLAAHDAVVACVYVDGTTLTELHDSQHNAYTRPLGPVALPGLTQSSLYLYVALDVAGGADTVTVTTADVSTDILLFVHEYSNVGGVDAMASRAGSGMAVGIDGITSGTADTHATGDLIFGFTITGSATPGTDFLARSTLQANLTEDRAVGAAGPYAATATMTSGDGWAMLMAALEPR